MIYKKCETEYETTPNQFLTGHRCPYCAGKMMNHEQFVKRVYELEGNEYEVIGKYTISSQRLKMKHLKCNKTYEVKPNNFLNGRRCPHCYGNKKKTHSEFVEEIFSLVGNEYSVLTKYINNRTKVKMLHHICNHAYFVTPSSFLSGVRCAKCAGNLKKTTDKFKEEVFNLVENNYSVIG